MEHICRFLKITSSKKGNMSEKFEEPSPYEAWTCYYGVDENKPLTLGAKNCPLKNQGECLFSSGPFGYDDSPIRTIK